MTMMKKLVLALAAVGLCSAVAAADPIAREHRRNHRQQERIAQGIQSGQLTPREADRLERREAHTNRVERRAAADGNVSPREARRIERMQNRNSRKIFRQKHDRQHM
jgi:hypothetical protein